MQPHAFSELRLEAEIRNGMMEFHPEPISPTSDAGELREWLEVALAATGVAMWSFVVSARVFQLSETCRALLAAPELEGLRSWCR